MELLVIAVIAVLIPIWVQIEKWLVRKSGGVPTAPYLRRRRDGRVIIARTDRVRRHRQGRS